MAQHWAYAFYHSKAWRSCRKGFLESKHWLCERCGRPANTVHHRTYLTPANINDPSVTLSWDNLEAVCEDCHNKQHHRSVFATRKGFAFDEDGNLVPTGEG